MEVLDVGTKVLTCLMSEGDMNALEGYIVRYDPSSLRYTIELDNGDMMSLSKKNIQAVNADYDKDNFIPKEAATDTTDERNDDYKHTNSLITWINEKAHEKPFDFITEGLFWWFVLCFVCFPASIVQLFSVGYNAFVYYWGVVDKDKYITEPYCEGTTTTTITKPLKKKLGIVITGCDSGFGKELAMGLLNGKNKDVFVVFCGCLLEDSLEHFQQYDAAVPMQMDVTKEKDIKNAAAEVTNWLSLSSIHNEQRNLHALVNNAGIGITGLVDWLDVSDFQRVFDVNYFGVLRCVKAFQPIFKGQAAAEVEYFKGQAAVAAAAIEKETLTNQQKQQGKDDSDFYNQFNYYPHGRIINVISVAGYFAPAQYGAPYASSKHALEALTNNLRQEMTMFNVKVIAIYPGFHNTPMMQNQITEAEKTLQKLTTQKRQEYGERFFQALLNQKLPPGFDSKMVVNTILDAIVLKDPPIQNFVGLDAKYLFRFFSKLPIWLSFGIFEKLMLSAFEEEEEYIPKCILDQKKKMEQQQQQDPINKDDKKKL